MTNGQRRVSPLVTDISSPSQLLRYATAGQLAQVHQHLPGISQAKIALGAGLGASAKTAAPALSAALRNGLTARQLENLDEIIGALVPDVDRTGGLCSLALRLAADRFGEGGHRDRMTNGFAAHVPPSWTKHLFSHAPAGDVGVLIQASALVAALMAAEKADPTGRSTASILDHYSQEVDRLVQRLILISVAPPLTMYYDAPILLGSLASYAFELMKDRLDFELRYSPLGFRVWRAITQLVRLSTRTDHANAPRDVLEPWVRGLIGDSEKLRRDSLYAGRSLDLELAISIPPEWSPPDDDWAHAALLTRATNSEATIRERGTAAMGLWQRTVSGGLPNRQETEQELRRLIAEFRDPETRPDAQPGLRWVAATLDQVIRTGKPVCNEWPDVDEDDKPWFGHVQEAANRLGNAGLPDHLRAGTKSLFLHMILQNAGVYRRHAIETAVAGGWGAPVAEALEFLLGTEAETQEAWLRIRAEFALSFLQRHDRRVEEHLSRACLNAYKVLQQAGMAKDEVPPRAHVTELHSSLFAVGDCFGVAGAEEDARRIRERLRTVLTDLAGMKGDQALRLRRPARAAAYLLTVTAQPRKGKDKDFSEELLEKLGEHPDKVTADLSRWALGFRFRPDGGIRPLLDAE